MSEHAQPSGPVLSRPEAFEPDRISISKSRGVTIEWKDGHRSEYTCQYLRDHCPCATCSGIHGSPSKSPGAASEASPFPMYRPKIQMLGVEQVGSYAIRILWNDQHNSGIYSFEYFRRICPCEQCSQNSRDANQT